VSGVSPLAEGRPGLRTQIAFAFACVYIIWGSTYLGIRYALISFPPWTMSAIRFLVASLLMGVAARFFRREKNLNQAQVKMAIISGALLITANSFVGIVEQWIASGTVAVMIGVMPIWIMLIGWIFFRTGQPSTKKLAGSLVGLFGIVLIATDSHTVSAGENAFGAIALLILSNCFWAVGTLLIRNVSALESPFKFSALQMASGALVTATGAFIFEKPLQVLTSPIAPEAGFALLYLITFGSLVGYTAYTFLSRTVEPHLVATYALVNPVIAVALGCLVASEPISIRFLFSTLFVLAGLALLLKKPRKSGKQNQAIAG
jgi:drug/metabolite transporter (DMT)-like permease